MDIDRNIVDTILNSISFTDRFYEITLDYRFVLYSILSYVIIVKYWNFRNSRMKYASKGDNDRNGSGDDSSNKKLFLKMFTFMHNLILVIYSAFSFVLSAIILKRHFISKSLFEGICDHNRDILKAGIGKLSYLFYLSKYYEFIDTLILLLKKKPVSNLQTIHHTGIIVAMWFLIITKAVAIWVYVLFNGFIHTIMYSYFAMTCFGIHPWWKKYLTKMQIGQFFLGNSIALIYLLMPNCPSNGPCEPINFLCTRLGMSTKMSQIFSGWFTFGYLTILVFLFFDFSKKTYSLKNKNKKE